METCKTLCLQNPQQCMTFAQKHGFDKKEEIPSQGLSSGGQSANSVGASVRPPCANDGSCQQYCAQHPDECPGYQTKPGLTPAGGELRPPTGSTFSSPSGGFVGPTGCRTEEECKAYCQTNPGKCPGFIKAEEKLRAYPSYAPIKTPGEYKGPTPYLNPGSNSGYPKPTGTQYNYPPPTYPTYIQSPPNSGYSQPTPMSGGYQPSTGTVQYQPMTNPLQ